MRIFNCVDTFSAVLIFAAAVPVVLFSFPLFVTLRALPAPYPSLRDLFLLLCVSCILLGRCRVSHVPRRPRTGPDEISLAAA